MTGARNALESMIGKGGSVYAPPLKNIGSETDVSQGFVYLMRCGWHHKIGKTKNVRRRLAQIQTGNPYKVELIHSIPCDDMAEVESALHKHFAQWRTNGEWFEFAGEISEEDVVSRLLVEKAMQEASSHDIDLEDIYNVADIRLYAYRRKGDWSMLITQNSHILGSWTHDRICAGHGEDDSYIECEGFGPYVDNVYLPVGTWVTHDRWGLGVVKSRCGYDNGDAELDVLFNNKRCRFMASFAPLRVISEDVDCDNGEDPNHICT